jgi:serine/threonine protein kinase
MALATVESLVSLLRDGKFLSSPQIKTLTDELARDFSNPEALVNELQQRDWLTAFQAARLVEGREESLTIGPYVLLEPLGEGGMGQVYKARHPTLDRVVALKVIRQQHLADDPEIVRRFQREARAAAVLTHPNVVLIYDSGNARDTYYIAMQYLEGADLARLVKEQGPLPIAQACDFIRQAAMGLQHLHEHGMVHRDIKPSNLMATSAAAARAAEAVDPGTTVADRPSRARKTAVLPRPTKPGDGPVIKLLDMGLVRLDYAVDRSANGSLTQAGSMVGTPDYIAPEQARDARRVDIRGDLYSLGCSFYYLLSGRAPFPDGTAIEKVLMHQLDEPKPIQEVRPEVDAEVAAVLRKLMAKRPMDRYQTPAEVVEALAPLAQPKLEPAEPPRTTEVALAPTLVPAKDETAPATPRVQVVPNVPAGEKLAASVFHWDEAAPKTPPVAAPEVEKLKKIAFLKGHGGCVMSLAFSPDRDTLASGALDCRTRVWTFHGKPHERSALRTHNTPVHALAFSLDNKILATGSGAMDGLVWLWDMREEHPPGIAVLQGHQGPIESLSFAPDGKFLASASSDKTVRVWEVSGPDYRLRCALKGHVRTVKAVAFAPDNKTVASGGEDTTVRLWNPMRSLWSKELAVLEGHRDQVRAVVFSPDGTKVASGGQDQCVILWDIARPSEKPVVLRGHGSTVRELMFTADGQTLVSVEDGRQVIHWDILTGGRLHTWLLPDPLITSFAFTRDARYLAAGTSEGPVAVYRLGEKKKSSSSASS